LSPRSVVLNLSVDYGFPPFAAHGAGPARVHSHPPLAGVSAMIHQNWVNMDTDMVNNEMAPWASPQVQMYTIPSPALAAAGGTPYPPFGHLPLPHFSYQAQPHLYRVNPQVHQQVFANTFMNYSNPALQPSAHAMPPPFYPPVATASHPSPVAAPSRIRHHRSASSRKTTRKSGSRSISPKELIVGTKTVTPPKTPARKTKSGDGQ
jgi:hypothetical protein